jgi:hypothetical protein
MTFRPAAVIALLALLALASPAGAEGVDLVSVEQWEQEKFSGLPAAIDPDRGPYGLEWSCTREDMVQAFGQPSGAIALDADRLALLYGVHHVFVFAHERLVEVCITTSTMPWMQDQPPRHAFFDSPARMVTPGFWLDTRTSILADRGIDLKRSDLGKEFTTDHAAIRLSLYSMGLANGPMEEYIGGIAIRPR